MKNSEQFGASPEELDFVTAEWATTLMIVPSRATVLSGHAFIFAIADAGTGKFIEYVDAVHGVLPKGQVSVPVSWRLIKMGTDKHRLGGPVSVEVNGAVSGGSFTPMAAARIAQAFQVANEKFRRGSSESSA
jgi:hypothetical protein